MILSPFIVISGWRRLLLTVKGKGPARQQKKAASEEAAQYDSCATVQLSEFMVLLCF
jgi:hypothetical protein